VAGLEEFGWEVESAIERVRVPSYVVDRHGIIRWLNPAAEAIVGDVRGRQATSILPPEWRRRAREIFLRNLHGPPEGSDSRGVILTADGERVAGEVSAVPIRRGGQVIGVFGQAKNSDDSRVVPPPPADLTPRQAEVLSLLEQGYATNQIADELHIAVETVRNHIRAILRNLGVHSRLEAVALAHRGDLATS
jgi:PAS domain S-box-containing protein